MAEPECVPTELWHTILTSACTDGGFTGRSLALTSHFFHNQSHSVRLHTLKLDSLLRVEGLLSFLRGQSFDCQPRVEHLYLSFLNEPVKRFCSFGPHQSKEKLEWEGRFVVAMAGLVAFIAPHLHTLCILGDGRVRFPDFPCVIIPELEELTIMGPVPFILPIDSEHPDLPIPLPALRRLHYVFNFPFSDDAYRSVAPYLAKHAPPSLTHLRFSDLSAYEEDFVNDLTQVMGVHLQTPTAPTEVALPNVSTVIVHIIPPGPSPCGHSQLAWIDVTINAEVCARACEDRGRARFLVLDRPWRRNPHWGDRVCADWLDRIAGGHGCWVNSDHEEAQLDVYEDGPTRPEEGDEPMPEGDQESQEDPWF